MEDVIRKAIAAAEEAHKADKALAEALYQEWKCRDWKPEELEDKDICYSRLILANRAKYRTWEHIQELRSLLHSISNK